MILMETKIYVDTGAFLGNFNKRDAYHDHARGIWLKLRVEKTFIVTINHVLDELATLLGRRAS